MASSHSSYSSPSSFPFERERQRRNRYRYSLDVLTDGSAHTGNGTVFLTVSRPPINGPSHLIPSSTANPNDQLDLDQDTLLARYALSGVSALTSRLASDQSLKLSYARAVFCPCRKNNVESIAGLPSLLLSLSNYAVSEKLFVVGDAGIEEFVEHVADLVLKRRNYPEIVTCVVPSPSSLRGVDDDWEMWWKVYQDEYIVVHARMERARENVMGDDDIVYIVTILSQHDNDVSVVIGHDSNSGSGSGSGGDTSRNIRGGCSFAIFPPGFDARSFPNALNNLPEEILSSRKDHALEFILYFHPALGVVDRYANSNMDTNATATGRIMDSVKLCIPLHLQQRAAVHLVTVPDNLPVGIGTDDDHGILIRSMKQSETLNTKLPCVFPLRFPESRGDRTKIDLEHSSKKYCDDDARWNQDKSTWVAARQLRSFTSVVLEMSCDDDPTSVSNVTVVNRQAHMRAVMKQKQSLLEKERIVKVSSTNGGIQDLSLPMQEIVSFYSPHKSTTTNNNNNNISQVEIQEDENELDLNESDDESLKDEGRDSHRCKRQKCHDDDTHLSLNILHDVSVPHLLVLGTGCASPAPLRGSSGYGLFLPTVMEDGGQRLVLSVVLECGEGYLTMLRRHDPTSETWETLLSHISLVWISHAHLDHYGGLPTLIHEISNVKGSGRMCTCYNQRDTGKRSNQTYIAQKSNHQHGMYQGPACQRCHGLRPTIVIAPTKVLRYLESSLDCKNGFINGQKIYVGINHYDFERSPFAQQVRDDVFEMQLPIQRVGIEDVNVKMYRPFEFLKNIQVDHCPFSYGCLMGLNIPVVPYNYTTIFTLCYSGDTRPSSNLVRVCQDVCQSLGRRNISLLLHEATFDDDAKGKQDATRKRHCTVQEAMGIARQVHPESLLLTHFSQRYPKFPPGHEERVPGDLKVPHGSNEIHLASAYDGMLIPLKEGLHSMLPLIGSVTSLVLSE